MARLLFGVVVAGVGCRLAGSSGPPTTHTNSAQFATVQEKTAFLHQYVSFRPAYETLDFDIEFKNNSAGVPGPSDWDVRLVATVPQLELEAWVPQGVERAKATPRDVRWLTAVPTSIDLNGVDEWYDNGRRTVGLDRQRRIVVWRDVRY